MRDKECAMMSCVCWAWDVTATVQSADQCGAELLTIIAELSKLFLLQHNHPKLRSNAAHSGGIITATQIRTCS